MPFVVVSPPASEPLTVEEVKRYCRIDGTNAEPAPGAIAGVALADPAAPGNVDNGAHRYLATFVTAAGETEAGIVSEPVTVTDKTVNGQVSLAGIPIGGAAVTARKIYRAAGSGPFLYHSTIADNTTTTLTDNLADASLGVGAPTVNTTDDPTLLMFIAAARQDAEQELNRYLVTQTIEAHLDEFPRGRPDDDSCSWFERHAIRLPPVQSVESVSYVDLEGNPQTIDPAQYLVEAPAGKIARVVPAYGLYWPPERDQPGAVTVRFVAGYGAASAVPQTVKRWMAMRVKTMWEMRDQLAAADGRLTLIQLPDSYVDGLLDRERIAKV